MSAPYDEPLFTWEPSGAEAEADALLAGVRALLRVHREQPGGLSLDQAGELADVVEVLDDLLSGGGAFPAAWLRRAVADPLRQVEVVDPGPLL